MNDDLTSLASAYLDDEASAEERARLEAHPDALAEVDRLRSVRALLSDVETPSISVREAHLAAALGAWERLPDAERSATRRDLNSAGIDAAAIAGAASVTAPTQLSTRRRSSRSSSTRRLTGAAAALVLVLAGGIALQLSTGEDTDDTDAAASSAEADTAEPAEAAEDPSADRAADEFASAPEAGDASAELDTGIDNAAPPGESGGLDELENLNDLADFAAVAVGAPVSPDGPAATSPPSDEELSEAETFLADAELPRCLGVDVIVGPAVYDGTPVVVGVQEQRNVAIAYRAATCEEIARVRLPRAGG